MVHVIRNSQPHTRNVPLNQCSHDDDECRICIIIIRHNETDNGDIPVFEWRTTDNSVGPEGQATWKPKRKLALVSLAGRSRHRRLTRYSHVIAALPGTATTATSSPPYQVQQRQPRHRRLTRYSNGSSDRTINKMMLAALRKKKQRQ